MWEFQVYPVTLTDVRFLEYWYNNFSGIHFKKEMNMQRFKSYSFKKMCLKKLVLLMIFRKNLMIKHFDFHFHVRQNSLILKNKFYSHASVSRSRQVPAKDILSLERKMAVVCRRTGVQHLFPVYSLIYHCHPPTMIKKWDLHTVWNLNLLTRDLWCIRVSKGLILFRQTITSKAAKLFWWTMIFTFLCGSAQIDEGLFL